MTLSRSIIKLMAIRPFLVIILLLFIPLLTLFIIFTLRTDVNSYYNDHLHSDYVQIKNPILSQTISIHSQNKTQNNLLLINNTNNSNKDVLSQLLTASIKQDTSTQPPVVQLQVSKHKVVITKNSIKKKKEITMGYKKACYKRKYSESDKTYVDHTPKDFLINEEHMCRGTIFMLIFVRSAIPHKRNRDLIRQTWGSVANINGDKIKLIFVMGTTKNRAHMAALKKESEEMRDIIQADFADEYRMLVIKHLYAVKWIKNHCSQAEYVLKTDDDVMINIFQMSVLLKEGLQKTKNFIYCKASFNEKPIRTERHKWTVSGSEWPDPTYPPLCKGFAYVMSGDIIEKIHHCAKWRRLFWIDDVFVTGAIREAMNIQLVGLKPGFGYTNLRPSHASYIVNDYTILLDRHNMMPDLYRRVWSAIVINNKIFTGTGQGGSNIKKAKSR